MTQRDRDRLKVLHEAEKGHLTQKQAGAGIEAEADRGGAGESGAGGEAGVPGLWADAGGRVSGGEARGSGEQRERAANPGAGGSYRGWGGAQPGIAGESQGAH